MSYLSPKDSDLLAEYCQSYITDRTPSSRFALRALMAAIDVRYEFTYGDEFVRSVEHQLTRIG